MKGERFGSKRSELHFDRPFLPEQLIRERTFGFSPQRERPLRALGGEQKGRL
jgi:hypothetical protein